MTKISWKHAYNQGTLSGSGRETQKYNSRIRIPFSDDETTKTVRKGVIADWRRRLIS